MAFPDTATLLLLTVSSNVLVAVFMALMHRAKPDARYFHLLGLGAAGMALGWSLYATRLWQWPSEISFLCAHLLVASYPALLLVALQRALDLPERRRWRWTLLLVMAALAICLWLAIGSRYWMTVTATAGNGVLYSVAAWVLLRHGRPLDLARWTILLAIAACALMLWVRLGSVVIREFPLSGGDPLLVSLGLIVPMLSGLILAMAFPVAEFVRDAQHLIALSERDDLTGLPNRAQALRRIGEYLEGRRGPLALGFFDLDGFKRINDSLGHAIGDALLVAIGARLKPLLQPQEVLARFGGDEFLVLLPYPPEPAHRRMRSLLAALDAPFKLDRREVHVAASAGLSAFPLDASSERELLRMADIALYQAKADGRGRVLRYRSAMGDAANTELAIEEQLRTALEQGRVCLYLQPRLDLADGVCRSAEALVRIRREDSSLLMPEAFIEVAERCGLMPRLGERVLELACAELANLRVHEPAFRLSINLSAVELQDPRLAARIADALQGRGLPPQALELELTESALIQQPTLAAERLAELHAQALRIALDDFGVGYSGLSHLLAFPISVLKIDRSFISQMLSERTAGALVEGLLALSARLGLSVVAEGVEDEETLQRLRTLGCDEAQGFVIARPMPPAELQAWLSASTAAFQSVSSSSA
jgi:diguanylate cyclase (GGDEF)-like protein